MSVSSVVAVGPAVGAWTRLRDYAELAKLRIALLELVVVAASGCVATWGQPDPAALATAMLGTLLVAASASAANQWLERHRDARMRRTAHRPLANGRLSYGEALIFIVTSLAAGELLLVWGVGSSSAGWAWLSWLLYVLVYTPLKARTSANTAVGAVAGALPVLIGWSAVGQALDARAAALVLLLFLWQFPHFMAIAWLYRDDYARAGYRMLTVIDPTGGRAGWQATLAALALLPVSLVPVLTAPGAGSLLYGLGATGLGLGQLAVAAMFWSRPDATSARQLLRASLVYLPLLLVLLMLVPWI
jgi:protoheme IX farnesyltransferase